MGVTGIVIENISYSGRKKEKCPQSVINCSATVLHLRNVTATKHVPLCHALRAASPRLAAVPAPRVALAKARRAVPVAATAGATPRASVVRPTASVLASVLRRPAVQDVLQALKRLSA